MEISFVSKEHPPDNVWEEYAFGRLGGEVLPAVEEHLLCCECCQKKLAETDEFIRLMKFGTKRFHPRRRLPGGLQATGMVLSGGVVAACLAAVIWLGLPISSNGVVTVELKSFRSGTETSVSRAAANHPLNLLITMVDAPSSSHLRLEVVTASGEPVWSSATSTEDGVLWAHMSKKLGAGSYWVRLYAQPSELLAEYGLKLE